ncbi:MAG: aminopeptidase P family protein [Chloroflexi bacterium]|nr:aminopeptidase P family protein [Chloroflexota bacterium]
MNYTARVKKFSDRISEDLDLVYLPISADMQYLTGIPREMPTFGAMIYPGMWVEGAWLAPGKEPIIALPRMTATFHGLSDFDADVRVLPDEGDPTAFVKDIMLALGVDGDPRIGLGKKATAQTVTALQSIFSGATFVDATPILMEQRQIKGEDEIAVMREAGQVTIKAFEAVVAQLKHGMTEQEIVSEVNHQLTKHGAIGPSFTTSMYNSGPEHALVFGKQDERWHRPLDPPVALLFDFGAAFHGYSYDFGRTVFFGEPSAEFRTIYDTVMASQAAGIEALRAGRTGSEVDQIARSVIKEAGYGEMFRHRLGHAIGLDVHEPPFLAPGDEREILAGMLFTVEPSIMQFDSFSARVEDIVLCTPDGGEPLTSEHRDLKIID